MADGRVSVWETLRRGTVIPAHPLALNRQRKLDERRQRALSRYYAAAGAGGLAVGVHTTQFGIHDSATGLLKPVLALAADAMDRADAQRPAPMVRVAGICGATDQAVSEAALARDLGYHLGLLSFSALASAPERRLLAHTRAVADVIAVFGFYLQRAVGGVALPYSFWRAFCEIEAVKAIKIAPFNRYQTIDVVRAVAESGRADIALYTGNDDNIVVDLVTPFRFTVAGGLVERRIVGGLLGHWAVWTTKAVELLDQCHGLVASGGNIADELLQRHVEVTDANAAIFDAAHSFRGCLPGIHEVLRGQGLLAGTWCLDENEVLSPGQQQEIDRVRAAYPHLTDDRFVAEHLNQWLAD
ncbi:MAG: dihydrodipicolinate synthase family protein [Planctomycetes bacterium RBG_16_64_10]|nr:MAG: dihydrodipicolinate synthase family protein [Planctomycetes bacterium RBG_16_64_10]